MPDLRYRHVVVKVSGEALMGGGSAPIDQQTLERIAADLAAANGLGIKLAVVIGGGNLVRGVKISDQGVPRATGDTMGMLATVVNALALEAALEKAGAPARVLSAIAMPQVCRTYSRSEALRQAEKGRVLVLAGGTGNGFFTTDTTAVLRACDLGCDAVLKATNVDGIYSADPKKDKGATRYDRLSHDEAISRDLKVMDATAFALARENHMPIIVFSIETPAAITSVLKGEGRATTVGG
jgi:uridylate kinase